MSRPRGGLRPRERAPKTGFRLVRDLADDGFDVALTCRVLGVLRSGYYESRDRPVSPRDLEAAYLANQVVDIHQLSQAPTRHRGRMQSWEWVRISRKRVARLLGLTGRAGIGGNSHEKRRKKAGPGPARRPRRPCLRVTSGRLVYGSR